MDLAIVIPAYKASFLRETLESIAKQTDKRFHLYIGDDCSPHNLKKIVDEYEDRIPLTYHRFDINLGGSDLVAQWGRCIDLTRGEPYIWLFSDDDVMESRCVELFYNCLNINNRNEIFHFDVNMIKDLEDSQIKSLNEFPDKISAGEFLYAKRYNNFVSYVVEFIFARDLYEKVDGFQNFDLAWGSDFMTWLKMACVSKEGIITIKGEKCKVNWRYSTENISPDKSHPILLRKIKALIQNAVFIRNLMKTTPDAFEPLKYSFRWVRFPLGEIYRERNVLSRKDIFKLCREYSKRVGFGVFTMLALLLILIKKQ